MTLLIIYLILNSLILTAMKVEGDLFPPDTNKKGKAVIFIGMFIFAFPTFIGIALALYARPIYVKYRWKQRQKRNQRKKQDELKASTPTDIHIRIY